MSSYTVSAPFNGQRLSCMTSRSLTEADRAHLLAILNDNKVFLRCVEKHQRQLGYIQPSANRYIEHRNALISFEKFANGSDYCVPDGGLFAYEVQQAQVPALPQAQYASRPLRLCQASIVSDRVGSPTRSPSSDSMARKEALDERMRKAWNDIKYFKPSSKGAYYAPSIADSDDLDSCCDTASPTCSEFAVQLHWEEMEYLRGVRRALAIKDAERTEIFQWAEKVRGALEAQEQRKLATEAQERIARLKREQQRSRYSQRSYPRVDDRATASSNTAVSIQMSPQSNPGKLPLLHWRDGCGMSLIDYLTKMEDYVRSGSPKKVD